jgi:hypothetical protein
MLTNKRFEPLFGHEINFASAEGVEFRSHPGECHKSHACPWLKTDQQIDVTLRAKVCPKGRTEDGEFTHLIAAAQGCQGFERDVEGVRVRHGYYPYD